MNEKVLRLFSSPVIVADVPDAAALCAELESAILPRADVGRGVDRTNVGGWHSGFDFFEWAGAAGQQLRRHFIALADAHTDIWGTGTERVQWQIQAWANLNRSGDSNSPHFHPGVYWSAVFYVKVGEGGGGQLVFHDPRMPALRMHAPVLRLKDGGPEGIAKIMPQAGQIIMFPAWLQHSVEPWQGESPRISVAVNLMAAQQLIGRDAPAAGATGTPAARPRRQGAAGNG